VFRWHCLRVDRVIDGYQADDRKLQVQFVLEHSVVSGGFSFVSLSKQSND
jgi:hypothetical protein